MVQKVEEIIRLVDLARKEKEKLEELIRLKNIMWTKKKNILEKVRTVRIEKLENIIYNYYREFIISELKKYLPESNELINFMKEYLSFYSNLYKHKFCRELDKLISKYNNNNLEDIINSKKFEILSKYILNDLTKIITHQLLDIYEISKGCRRFNDKCLKIQEIISKNYKEIYDIKNDYKSFVNGLYKYINYYINTLNKFVWYTKELNDVLSNNDFKKISELSKNVEFLEILHALNSY